MPHDADDEYKRLCATHEKNQDARERFMPAAHAAILAGSIAFVGQVARPETGHQMWLVIGVWISSGLAHASRSLRFMRSSRYITAMINHVDTPPEDREKIPEVYISKIVHDLLSVIPIALLIPSVIMTIVFATINVWR